MKDFLSKDKSFWGFKYAIEGLFNAIRTERHFRFHICAAAGTLMFTEYFELSRYDYGFLVLAIVLVMSAELINTAIEHTVDLCTEVYSVKAKIAKDTSAAFVLITALFALFVAAMLFLGKGLLRSSLLDIFKRPKYILFFIFTVIFVHGGIFKWIKNSGQDMSQ